RSLAPRVGTRICEHGAKPHLVVAPPETAAALHLTGAGGVRKGRGCLIDTPAWIGLSDKIIDRTIGDRDLTEHKLVRLQPDAAGLAVRYALEKRAILRTDGERRTHDFEP